MDGKTVLYIEDSSVEREIVRRLLEAEGFDVRTASRPDEGIELAGVVEPDLILVDLHLPGMDGSAIASRLRAIPRLASVPIVAFSASINEESREEARSAFDAFMEKPVDVDLFPARIRELIKAGRSGRGASRKGPDGEGTEGAEWAEETREVLETLERVRSAMSHDLRTPLTVMISYASTVGRGKVGSLTERQREMLELVVEQGFQMDALIAELVSVARETLQRYGYPPK